MNPLDNPRASKLKKLFDSIIHGKQPLTRQNNALFLEAICVAPDAATSIDKLISSGKGLISLQASLRFDLTSTFFNGPVTTLLQYISAPELATIGGGAFLNNVLLSIVEPPIFWTAFRKAFQGGQLQENAQFRFAWLLLQLISLPGKSAVSNRETAEDPSILNALLSSPRHDIRLIAQKIKHIIATCSAGASEGLEYSPGGRHDNDFVNFREIAILPTADELVSKEQPFLRPSAALGDPDPESGLATHLDNQFRLLREDMLYEMRDELRVALGMKKGKYRGFVVDGLTVRDIHYKLLSDRKCKWGIALQCHSDLWQLKNVKPQDRKTYLTENRKIFKHQSMACLLVDQEIVGFSTVNRDEDLLARKPSIVVLQFEGQKSTTDTLLKLYRAKHIKLLQIDTAVFSYEPILTALQEKQSLLLSPELLFWTENSITKAPASQPTHIVESIRANPRQNLQDLLKTPQRIQLDQAQADSLLSGLTQRVSLIQGPPGTGKSFIGALLAKVLHDFAHQTVLVVCYTNHALDQFLEDLLDIGIPGSSIVRLGGKSTQRTAGLALQKQRMNGFNRRPADWKEINDLKLGSDILAEGLVHDFQKYKSFNPQYVEILEHLEFDHVEYFEAFRVPQSTDGMQQIGRRGRAAGPDYLLDRWVKNQDAGISKGASHVREASEIWQMPLDSRRAQIARWRQEMLKDLVDHFSAKATQYNRCQSQLDRKYGDNDATVLRSKRIIGCTTTGAAKYREDIHAARPGVLLVEEAGEIHESHILTALGAETEQLILIGDHKQLRPKVNNYMLTVEKGEGFDLNRSLFERLVLKGYPHETLREQHRMRPEISTLIRQLTYPGLVDAAKTHNRPSLRGVQDNVIFINHDHPEDDVSQLEESRDMGAKSSKQNKFEVEMVLRIVRYLAQQGYGTDKIVVLTPYLGQLRELQDALKKDNDPFLNDLDSYDLVRAGVISSSAAKMIKKPLRLATIDNYQGEESDIVIASLTRSNKAHDIGFMSSPQRLNVLLSRARNAFIMIGNAHTFKNARKGSEIWTSLFDLLKRNGHVYDGLPVKCERHTNRMGLLKCADDFDKECPDGGCLEPCVTMLNCGLHPCPSKCHQLADHSKMPCEHIMFSSCPKGHRQQWKCQKGLPVSCVKCDREKKIAEKKQQEEFALQEKRDAGQRLHTQRMAEIDNQISQQREALRDAQLSEERKQAIHQKEKDLTETRALAAQASLVPPTTRMGPQPTNMFQKTQTPSAPSNDRSKANSPTQPEANDGAAGSKHSRSPVRSAAREEWQRQKDIDGAINDAIDAIMEMTGLEDVKKQVLKIKDKVDITKRQNSSLKGERFNVSMLGNPGTGKTTVARHYGKFLASVQVIPGNLFIETTGSRLANDGVPGIKKQLEELINAGGGTIFVDEAYQLTSTHNFQGSQVLDFLLAEMENNVGKIVFIFAGCNQEMEKFFEHNPGLTSRVPYTLQFKDYEDHELLSMLEDLIAKTYSGKMNVDDEDGVGGLYGRIAVRRLGRGRGRKGFGNARALANMFAKIRERQAERIAKERLQGHQPNDFLFIKEDLIGPDPSKVMVESAAWKKLQSLIGLGAVKKSVANLFFMVNTNYQRELKEKAPHQISLNRVFLGSPGTGKTTVAQCYGRILTDLGLLSNGEVVMKNPADFIGSALGQSESQTKAILANTVGKILIIDEAYMLYGGSGTNSGTDSYKTAVIDTIVAEVQSVPGEDRCVLLLGYKQQIEEMFQNVNPGLSRRFAIEDAFHFHDYTDSELLQALELKLKGQDLTATDAAKTVAIEVLSRARNRPNFGNIGEVENLLSRAKNYYQARQASLPMERRSPDAPFEPQDFDPEFDRNEHAATNLAKLFEDAVGCEDIVEKLGGWQKMARNMKALGKDPREHIPTNFVFKGPPGTGKTTTARKMSRVYYDMGFLSSTEVVECSATDLVGEYVGHTGPKTKKLFEKALGRVLFIDEAYRLSQGHFAKEAIDELVGILTQERFRSKLVVILAGYDREMNELMAVNTGLSSRFSEEIIFHNMPPAQCLEVLKRKLRKDSIRLDALEDPSLAEYARMVDLLQELSRLPSWGNARDLETLSKQMMAVVFTSLSPPSGVMANDSNNLLTLTGKEAVTCIESMLSGRRGRAINVPARSNPVREMQQMLHKNQAPPPPAVSTTQTIDESSPLDPHPGVTQENVVQQPAASSGRDAGVTDQVWHQLQIDKRAAEDAARRSQETMRLLEQELREAEAREEAARVLAEKLAEVKAEQAEVMRKREEARLREHAARVERAERAAALEAEEKRQREEARVQTKLRQMGVCVAGFQWIKQSQGYRCAGGTHFIDNAALGI